MSEMTELHVRTVRAILGCFLSAPPERRNEISDAVLYGEIPHDAYQCLAAVASSLFAAMAVRERGPGGRARRGVTEVVQVRDFAENTSP